LPLTYEQNINAEIVKTKMIGAVLNYKEMNEEALEVAIKHLLSDKTVKENVDKLASMVKDSRTHPLEVSKKSNYLWSISTRTHFPLEILETFTFSSPL
jgi:UDP:flavonoid glycosyltransferase YjiC (YdhE family)